jgi:hypothetical protein
MTRMSDISAQQTLQDLPRGPSRRAGTAPAPAEVTADACALESNIDIHASAASACNDPVATHDLAAFRAGLLSPAGIQRLAGHVAGCSSCKLFIATMVAEATGVDSTAMHAMARRSRG